MKALGLEGVVVTSRTESGIDVIVGGPPRPVPPGLRRLRHHATEAVEAPGPLALQPLCQVHPGPRRVPRARGAHLCGLLGEVRCQPHDLDVRGPARLVRRQDE